MKAPAPNQTCTCRKCVHARQQKLFANQRIACRESVRVATKRVAA
jgi:hypothetical protein